MRIVVVGDGELEVHHEGEWTDSELIQAMAAAFVTSANLMHVQRPLAALGSRAMALAHEQLTKGEPLIPQAKRHEA